MTIDVFQHNNSIIDHQSDSQHQRQKRQNVDGEAKKISQGKGADNGGRNGKGRNDSGAETFQEEQNDDDNQNCRNRQSFDYLIERFLNEGGGIIGDIELHSVRQQGAQFAHLGHNIVGDLEGARFLLFDDTKSDRRFAIPANCGAVVFGAQLHQSDIAKPNVFIPFLLDNDSGKFFGSSQFATSANGELPSLPFDPSRRNFRVFAADSIFDIIGGQLMRRHSLSIEPDPHSIAAFAADEDRGYSRKTLDSFFENTVGEVGQFQSRMTRGIKSQPDNRLGVGINFTDNRVIGFTRQNSPNTGNALANIIGGFIDITAQFKLNGDDRALFAAGRG